MKPGSIEAARLRNETVLRHLHASGYDFEVALAAIAELLQHEQRALAAGSGSGSPSGRVTRQRELSRRLDEAMKRYGKDFEKAKCALNQSTIDDVVTVGQLVVHYYAKWKHSDEYNQWIDTADYKQQQRGVVAIEAQSSTGAAGMIADGQSKSQKKAQRRQRRKEQRKKKVRAIDSCVVFHC